MRRHRRDGQGEPRLPELLIKRLYAKAAENGEPQLQNKRGRLTTLNESTRLKTENPNSRIKEALKL